MKPARKTNKSLPDPRELAQELGIGAKIKELRKQRDLTLQAVAQETGFSLALISQIEHGKVSPPIATLARLAAFFDVSLGHFFVDRTEHRPYGVVRRRDRHVVDRVVSKNRTQHGYRYEALSSYNRRHRMEAFFLTVDKLAKKNVNLYSHEGEEFLYVMSGSVRLLLGDEEVSLAGGDAVYFDSSVGHRLLNVGRGRAKVIAVICK